MSTTVSLYTVLTVWWHKCRYQLLSIVWLDSSTYFGSGWLFGQLLAAKECMSACSMCTSPREAMLLIHADITDCLLHFPVSHSIPLHYFSVSSYIISVLYHNTWKFTVLIKGCERSSYYFVSMFVTLSSTKSILFIASNCAKQHDWTLLQQLSVLNIKIFTFAGLSMWLCCPYSV
jgi:hypothetical protein